MRVRALLTILTVGLVIVPAVAAVIFVENARYNRFFGDRINYLTHISPAAGSAKPAQAVGYDVFDVRRDGLPVPRRFLTDLPEGLDEMDVGARKELFTATLLPLVLRVNELIAADRIRVEDIVSRLQIGQPVSAIERQWLVSIANEYRVQIGLGLEGIDLEKLLRRVDVVPPSLALAQAAIESGWGTSRFARIGNALYGQWTWDESKGMVPEERPDGTSHSVRAFDYLMQSVYGYMRNLNTHQAYAEFRRLRAEGGIFPASRLAETLTPYSERGEEYVAEVKNIIRANRLAEFDSARLEPVWWAAP